MGSSRALSTQTDPMQLKLYSLHKQARFGSYETCVNAAAITEGAPATTAGAITGTETESQIASWIELEELSMEDAKREFLKVLFSQAPYWKYEQFLHE